MSASTTASSDVRRITTYGKRRVQMASTHRDWMLAMGTLTKSGASLGSSSSSIPLVPSVTPLVPESPSLPFPTSSPASSTVATNVNNKERRRLISIESTTSNASSASSTSSSNRGSRAVKQPARRRILVSDSDDDYAESPKRTQPQQKVDNAKVVRKGHPRVALRRKDSNLENVHPSPLDGRAVIKSNALPSQSIMTKHVSVSGIDDVSDDTADKENSAAVARVDAVPLQASSPVKIVRPPSQAHSRPLVHATRFPLVSHRLPAVGVISPRPFHVPSTLRNRYSSSSSATTASGSSGSSTTRSRLQVAPPQGHGVDAAVQWRRPLTPNVRLSLPEHRSDVRKHTHRPQIINLSNSPSMQRVRKRQTSSQVDDLRTSPAATPSLAQSDVPVEESKSVEQIPSQDAPDNTDFADASESAQAAGLIESKPALVSSEPSIDSLSTALDDLKLQLYGTIKTTGYSQAYQPLGATCNGDTADPNVYDFGSLVSQFPLVSGATKGHPVTWTKIGEATFSEVYSCTSSDPEKYAAADSVVVKVIPLHADSPEIIDNYVADLDGSEDDAPGREGQPFTTALADVEREILITRALSDKQDSVGPTGFTELKAAFIAKGSYPPELLQAWDDYKLRQPRSAENPRPHGLGSKRMYALVCLAHGGEDLERVKLTSWTQAASILWQTTKALAYAEDKLQFEHRDLHWGNILVQEAPEETVVELDDTPACLLGSARTVKATIIDFTLARASLPNGQILSGGLDDDSMFDGQGDQQYECYRQMRRLVNGSWETFCPTTNVVWLHYLVNKLLTGKKLKKPTAKKRARSTIILASGHGTPRKARNGRSGAIAVSAPLRSGIQGRAGKPSSAAEQISTPEQVAYDALLQLETRLSNAVKELLDVTDRVIPVDKKRNTRASAASADSSDAIAVLLQALGITSAGDVAAWWLQQTVPQ